MATARLYSTFVLLLYLQGNYAQQGIATNQNLGVNNGIGLQQQQALQRTNTPNNINQIPNGGLNMNLPLQSNLQQNSLSQSNLQQGSLQHPVGANLQGNLQQSLSLPANLQSQGASVPLTNLQFTKQGLVQLPPGLVANPSNSQAIPAQFNNADTRQNAQIPQQQSMGLNSNVPMFQTQNTPFSSNSLAELAALKGQPLLSLFASQAQNNIPVQQNHQTAVPNFIPAQNQLTDVQKQTLVRSLQSQSTGQSQPGRQSVNFQTQLRVAGKDNQPAMVVQGQVAPSQQGQAMVTPMGNQPAYITVQAQPLSAYLQNQLPLQEEEPSLLSLILSEFQPPDAQYNVYPSYQIQKKGSKSNLKTLIPLIINLLKEKNSCACRNCGCPNNVCGNNNMQEPTIFSGYSNQKNYSQGVEEPSTIVTGIEDIKTNNNSNENKNDKTNIVNVDSDEVSEENDSEYVDDSEGD